MANNDQLKQLLNMGLSALTGGDQKQQGGINDLIEHLTGGGDAPEGIMGTVENLLGSLMGGASNEAQQVGSNLQQDAQQVQQGVQAIGHQVGANIQQDAQQVQNNASNVLSHLSQMGGHAEHVAKQKAQSANNSIMGALNNLANNANATGANIEQHTAAAHNSIMDALTSLTGGAQQASQDAHSTVQGLLGGLDKDQLGSVMSSITSLLGGK